MNLPSIFCFEDTEIQNNCFQEVNADCPLCSIWGQSLKRRGMTRWDLP